MHDHTCDVICGESPGKSGYFHKSETHECEPGLIYFITGTCESVCKLAFGASQVLCVEFSEFVEYFGMPEGNYCTLWSVNLKPDPADHILPHVNEKAAFR